MLKRLVPSMLALAVGATPVFAASEGERDTHFETVITLVDKGMRLTAERTISAFEAEGYPSQDVYMKGLRYYYADFFRTIPNTEVAEALEAEYQRLDKELKGRKDSLPGPVKALVSSGGLKEVQRYTNIIMNEMNPDAPPPLVKFTAEKQAEMTSRVRRLIEATDRALDAAMAAVKAHEPEVERSWDLDPDKPEYAKIMQKAALLRADYAVAFYTAYKALREVVERGEQFGLPASVADSTIEPWLHTKLSENMDQLADWDWNYDFYPLLKHRLAVMLAEAVRLNEAREDLGKISNVNYEDVKNSFFTVIDTDISGFDRKFQEGFRALKLEAWSDLIHWHLLIGTDRALSSAADLWDDVKSRGLPLVDRNKSKQAAAGHLYILAARVYGAKQQANDASAILIELKNAKSFFSGNAKLWITYINGQGGGAGGGWASLPVAAKPEVVIPLADELRRTANNSTDKAVADKLKLDAAVALRNGILGLPPSGDPDFIEWAPILYQKYTYALWDIGRWYEATLVAQEGTQRLLPLWERSDRAGGNPWLKNGEVTSAGQMAQRLAYDYYANAAGLRRRDPSSGANDLYSESIAMLKTFDPEKAGEGLVLNQILIAIQKGDFNEALSLLDEYESDNPDKKLKVMNLRASVAYQQYNNDLEGSASETTIADRKRALDAAVETLRAVVEPVINGDEKAPEGQLPEYERAYRFLTTVKVSVEFRSENFTAVMDMLNEEFWAQLQDDPTLNRQLLNYLIASAYKVNLAIARDRTQRADPAVFMENWPRYKQAYSTYEVITKRWPEMVERLTGNRKQLSEIFNVSTKQADWFAQNVAAKKPGFESYKEAEFKAIAKDAKAIFGDVFPIENDTKPQIVLAVAMAKWDLGKLQEAVPLFETFKQRLQADPALVAFSADPTKVMDQLKAKFAARSALKKFWERKGDDSIPDLLIDAPGLKDEIENPNIQPRDWSEKKRDFGLALAKVNAFEKEFERQGSLIPDFEALKEEFKTLKELVTGLAYAVSIDIKLVEAYRLGGRQAEAVKLAQELYSYDPLNLNFMTLVVDGTLEAIKAGDKVSNEDAKKAQGIAARLRNNASRIPDKRDLYWIASIQVLELSHYLKEIDLVNKILTRHVVDRNVPPIDLSKPGTQPMVAKNASSVSISQRYLDLFDKDGVTESAPFRIEERDGETLFLWKDEQ